MRVAVLSSVHPSFGHARAGYVVLASLLQELGRAGHEVNLYTACCVNQPDATTLARLRDNGVTHMADLTSEALPEPRLGGLSSDVRTVLKALLPAPDDDYPHFSEAAAQRILADGAQAVLLFWDSLLEYLLPALQGVPVVGYLARPRTASPLAAIAENRLPGALGLRHRVARRNLLNQQARHLARLRALAAATNICALDAAWYRAHGVPCDYLANTWPDAFGESWAARRAAAEGTRAKVSVLANIGAVNATGNGFGLAYLAREVLPLLEPGLRERIEINICGGGKLEAGVAKALESQGAKIRGFVDDIDGEVLANRIFLLLNNAGPYTGGYTRVAYAFSAGACLIAHRKLAESMPEVVHGDNALLGSTPAEIAQHLQRATDDPALARTFGEAARQRYLTAYAPAVVARGLAERLQPIAAGSRRAAA
jgi:hypothetical protein